MIACYSDRQHFLQRFNCRSIWLILRRSPASLSLFPPLACPSSPLSDTSNTFFLRVALLFTGTFVFLGAGISSLEAASFAALALVVGFRTQEGGFFEVALGGGAIDSAYATRIIRL